MTREPRHYDLRIDSSSATRKHASARPRRSEQRKIARIKTAVNGYFTHRTAIFETAIRNTPSASCIGVPAPSPSLSARSWNAFSDNPSKALTRRKVLIGWQPAKHQVGIDSQFVPPR